MASEIKTVLVTGGTGFIGQNVCRMLVDNGLRVIALVRGSAWNQLPPGCATPHSIWTAFNGPQIDAVIHLATHYQRESGELAIGQMFDTNVGFASSVLSCAIEHRVPLFINTGSFMEYESPGVIHPSMNEGTPLLPINTYAVTKASFHLLAQAMCRNTGTSYTCLRLFSPYGPCDRSDKIIPATISDLLANRQITPLRAPHNMLDFVFVQDVVDAYWRVLQQHMEAPGTVDRQTFNIGSGQSIELSEVVNTIRRLLGKAPEVFGTIPRTLRVTADITQANRWLGWTPRTSLEEGLKETIQWHREISK